jgi:hypothetical protein
MDGWLQNFSSNVNVQSTKNCQKCTIYIHDFLSSPLPITSPIKPHIREKVLGRLAPEITTIFKQFFTEIPVYEMKHLWSQNAVRGEAFITTIFNNHPKWKNEFTYVTHILASNGFVKRNIRNPLDVALYWLNYQITVGLFNIPQVHYNHIFSYNHPVPSIYLYESHKI